MKMEKKKSLRLKHSDGSTSSSDELVPFDFIIQGDVTGNKAWGKKMKKTAFSLLNKLEIESKIIKYTKS